MRVIVKRGDVEFTCTTEEQLKSFLEDGYEEVKEAIPEPPKKATKKK